MMLNLSLFALFFLTSIFTVASPGVGVFFALTTAVNYGLRASLFAVAGTVVGTVVMATAASSALGLVIATSPAAFNVVKMLGAAFMAYLGIRFLRAKTVNIQVLSQSSAKTSSASVSVLWVQAFFLQLSNPQLILNFTSVFPQFIDPSKSFAWQVAIMSVTYGVLVAVIHSAYCVMAAHFRDRLASPSILRIINVIAGLFFLGIAVWVLSQIAFR
jgi:homoserine/homoserine lactone efflux protein